MKFAQSSAVYFNYSLSYAIKDLHHLGYDGIEIWGGRPHMYKNDLNKEINNLKSLLKKFDMNVCNFIPAQFRYPSILCAENEVVRKDSISYIKKAIDNAEKIGSPSISLCPGMVLFDKNINEGRKNLIKSFKEIEEYSIGKNILLLVDIGHCHINGENLEEVFIKCKNLPLHIHIDDNFGNMDSHLIPKEGNIDFEKLAKVLDRIDYENYISVELGTSYIMNPHNACKKSIEVLKKLFKKGA
jgi:protein FrlC